MHESVLPPIHSLPLVEPRVPAAFERLVDLAFNLWWSWDPGARDIWEAIDPVAWARYRNPLDLLRVVEPRTWQALESSSLFQDRYAVAAGRFDAYMAGEDTWYARHGRRLAGPVAYLCAEFGIHESLPFYSGGLGILAGDHAKSASDLGVPMVGVGLLYRRGYFRQEIDADGDQQHIYPTLDLRRYPVRRVTSRTGGHLSVEVEFPGRVVSAGVWKLDVGRVPLLLLDTDVPENDPADRPITHQLYVSGREMRFCQELVLGVGGVRALGALGIDPAVWHVNEGHAAMSLLERLDREVERGRSLDQATAAVRARTVFTLHTPVPAGNEVFHPSLVRKYLGPWAERLGDGLARVAELGLAREGDEDFDLGALAIKLSRSTNGVSKRHAEVVSRDWAHLLDGPALAVTNGVHTPTWVGPDAGRLYADVLGSRWVSRIVDDPLLLERLKDGDGARLWAGHTARKDLLVRFIRDRVRSQLARHGGSPDDLRAVESMLPPDRLTLGFARRFAAYKRATLMFHDPERLAEILTDPDRPVQVIFAGKAHPADQEGQSLIRRIVELSRTPEFRGHVVVLEDYDARMARFLVQGVDVWMNSPRPPMEASGTSGMKAAINGVLNCSVLDGWWVEGYGGTDGWAFGSSEAADDRDAADAADAADLYRLLSEEIVPLFYERDAAGIPRGWVERMQVSVVSALHSFSADRMVAQYLDEVYLGPAPGSTSTTAE
jgi:starch phosphorylase